MVVTVRLFATLQEGRFVEAPRDYPLGASVATIVGDLSIPDEEIGVVFVNGRNAELDRVISSGDVVSIFPPIGGG
jgi:molybdopterin synthase sulfur carrier subunit